MQNSNPNLVVSRVPGAWGSLLVLIGFVLIGMAVGNILAVMILALYTSADTGGVTELLGQLITNPSQVKNGWYAMMVLQGTVHFFSYLLPSLIYWFYIERKSLQQFDFRTTPSASVWFLAIILVIVFIPVNSKFIEWNGAMEFPEMFSGLEKWMRDKEDQLSVMTAFLTEYDQFGQLLIALFVVVLLPALGEEVLFRGIIQTRLAQQWGNIHLAIWVSAAIFSAIHFQFYGFLPRMMLGALFGYLYYWTGNLKVAVLGHFVNNGFVLVMMYLHNINVVDINIEEKKSMPWMMVLASIFLSAGILNIIKKSGTAQNAAARTNQ